MRVDTSDILITGSACLGFSLSPHKNFKVFNDRSDIDVSIVSQHYFDVAWHDLINISRPIIAANMKEAIDDHRQRLIYWGTIATDRILPLLSFGKEWDNIINKNRFHSPLDDRNINFRVYKDKLAIRNYLSLSVKDRKNALLEAQAK